MGRRTVVLVFVLLPALLRATILINEIAFDEPSGSPDWVELFNAGPGAQSVDRWTLTDLDTAAGKEIYLAFPTPIPEGSFLVVFVDAVGPADSDFSDGTGSVYSGTATTVDLNATEDELALFNGPTVSTGTLADFMAWVTVLPYDGETNGDQTFAVAAGVWTLGDVFSLSDSGGGYSIGRGRDGVDADRSSDFRFFQRPTRGLSNTPPPSPYPSALTVDPARRAFSPFDPDPWFQTTRFYFNSNAEAMKTIRVLDVRGRAVRTLVEGDREVGGADFSGTASGSVPWDGRDDAGTVVPLGLYLATLEAADPGSGETQRARASVAVGRP
ncbi:MAG: lamin tail domain-containing protein [Elusimicrobia bacterium]|nr:lamin tail domain-containing protein [Elusimicrobiota bacterium]